MAIEQAQKDKIKSALEKLDHNNPDHWSDDGLPLVSVIQKLANDPNIRRSDVNETAPGYARLNSDPPEEVVEVAKVSVTESASKETGVAPPVAQAGEETSGSDTQPRDFAALDQRVTDLRRQRVARKKANDTDDRQFVLDIAAAELARDTVRPRISAARNIKDFLASEHAKRVAAAAVLASRPAAADYGAGRGFRQGSSKPSVKGPDGLMHQPQSREVLNHLARQQQAMARMNKAKEPV